MERVFSYRSEHPSVTGTTSNKNPQQYRRQNHRRGTANARGELRERQQRMLERGRQQGVREVLIADRAQETQDGDAPPTAL
jgi:hypothetical protein